MGILLALITVSVVLIVIATAFPIVWPMVTRAGYGIVGLTSDSENITGMITTDAGTTTMQGFWPLILLVVGIGIAIGLIMYGLKKFQIMSKG